MTTYKRMTGHWIKKMLDLIKRQSFINMGVMIEEINNSDNKQANKSFQLLLIELVYGLILTRDWLCSDV